MESALKTAIVNSESDVSPRNQYLFLLFLVVLTLCVFANSFPATFIGDDFDIVVNNPLVKNIDLAKILTTDYWGEVANSGLFRPLTILSFGVGHLVWGDSANMVHAVNLGLHLLTSLLLVVALQGYGLERRLVWLTSLLFALHPIHTEVLNEAVGRAELLAALGVLIALWGWQYPRKSIGVPLLVIGYTAGLLAKEHAIVLLGLLPMLAFFSERYSKKDLKQLLQPYALLCGITGIWLAWRAWGVARLVPLDGYDRVYTPLAYLQPSERVLTALKFQWLSLRKLLFPFDLQGIYSGTDFFKPVPGLFSFEGILLLVATILLLVGVFLLVWKRQPIGLGLLFYIVAVTPVANLFFVTGATFAERLVYLPSVGLCLAMAALFLRVLSRSRCRSVIIATVFFVGFYLSLTVMRNPDFRSPQALWQKDVTRDPENVLAWLFLAKAEASTGRVDQARESFLQMQKRAPQFNEGLRLYAQFLLAQGEYSAAIKIALQVVEDPEAVYPEIYLVLGRSYVAVGDYASALQWLNLTPRTYQKYGIYWECRGRALEGMGDVTGAIESYQRMRNYPLKSEIPARLGRLLLQSGQVESARQILVEAVKLAPSSAVSWNSLGVSQAMGGDLASAYNSFAQAVRLAPENSRYRDNLNRTMAP